MTAPPDPERRSARVADPGASGETAQQTTHPSTFRIVIDGRHRAMPWGSRVYLSEIEAELEAAKIRKNAGLVARVERVEPEFGASRRRFLIAAFMAGWIGSDRVVERIAADVAAE